MGCQYVSWSTQRYSHPYGDAYQMPMIAMMGSTTKSRPSPNIAKHPGRQPSDLLTSLR